MSLWGGRFIKSSNLYFKKFNNSLKIDCRLLKEDILSSIAWSKVLCDSSVLTSKEQKLIESSLQEILRNNLNNINLIKNSKNEDIHSWVEDQLIQKIGSLGKKLHTGRSRNDQVATDLKLFCKKKIYDISDKIISLQESFLNQANRYKTVFFPGYTHLQKAQPITFSYWCIAYIEMLERDRLRLKESLKRLDISPLGSGALSGTSWNIDRNKLAKLMGFSSCTKNGLDSVSDRDFLLDILFCSSTSMMHLSRFSEDLIFYNSCESGLIEFSDSITSGSSLMPQKKNPDILELIRGKCSSVYGNLFSVFVLLKGLPLSYNKDLQEDKIHLFSSLDTWSSCLDMAVIVLNNMLVNVSKSLISTQKGYSNATELADYLVLKGIPFRDAHYITGRIILYAIKKNKILEKFDLKEFQKFSSLITQDVFKNISLDSCLKKKNSIGGSSFNQVNKELKNIRDHLESLKKK